MNLLFPNLVSLTLLLNGNPKGHHLPNWLHPQWYLADTPGPAILGLPSSSKFEIVKLNCNIQLAHRCRTPTQVRNLTTEQTKDQHDLPCPWKAQYAYQRSTQTTTTSTQHTRRPYHGLLWLLQRYWAVPQELPHHLKRWCQTCYPYTKEVSYSHPTPGLWQARWVHQSSNHCFSNGANTLGVITNIFMES